MTVRDTLLREHRFLERLLDRLEAALRPGPGSGAASESAARLQVRHLLLLLSPCLEAHQGFESLLRAPRPAEAGPAPHGPKVLREDLKALLAHGDGQPFDQHRDAVLRLIERVRGRARTEDARGDTRRPERR
ncbi:MAG: hypothetical protein HY554_05585 [Elusimicrobia bacterium]|nr:hypothetical protein [Elusimicrobiota bacterium]